uniref:Uncharacterized protein n=1 Tax=Timema cristinae TaxID=61476 RepID=A0A7R9CNE3_TIMCR|nr:unnamed protein product [Timema cristinae]
MSSGNYSAMPEEGIILNALAMVLVALGILLSYAVRRDSFRTENDHFAPFPHIWDSALNQALIHELRLEGCDPLIDFLSPLNSDSISSSISVTFLLYQKRRDLVLIWGYIHNRNVNWAVFNQPQEPLDIMAQGSS